MNIREIAARAGYSVATVSRVLNGKTNASSPTSQTILQVVEAAGYIPKVHSSVGRYSVGVLCSDVRAMVFPQILYNIDQSLSEAGYNVLVGSTGPDAEARKRRLEHLLSQDVVGLMLIGSYFAEGAALPAVLGAARRMPVVMVNNDVAADNVFCVMCNEREAFCDNASRLLNEGVRRILCLYDTETASCHNKIAGVRDAFSVAGLPFDENMVRRVDLDIAATRADIQELWASGQRFDAVFGTEDALAVAAIQGLADTGVRVPQDVRLLGCNNSQLAQACTPTLTSVDNKPGALGSMAARLLLDAVHGHDMPARVTFSAETVFRESLPA